jgi:hypothetical protein
MRLATRSGGSGRLGTGWLDVRLRGGPADVAGEVVTLLLMTAGIVMTAHVATSGRAKRPG